MRLRQSLRYAVLILVALLIQLLSVTAATSMQMAATPTPGSATPTAGGRIGDKPPGGVHLSYPLYRLVVAQQQGTLDQEAARMGIPLDGGRVEVAISTKRGELTAASAAARAAGGQVRGGFDGFVQASVPVAALIGLSQHSSIRRIDLPPYPVPAGHPNGQDGEGVNEVNAKAWHNAGVKGRDVKIGIIDVGFQDYTGLLGVELPADVNEICNPVGQVLENGDRHGTAVAEIIHEVGPEAMLYIATVGSLPEMREAAQCMAREGVAIINQSVNWNYHGPGDGSGFANDIVREAINAPNNILWVNSAGNHAQDHWRGDWTDPEGNQRLNFAGADELLEINLSEADFARLAALPANLREFDFYLRWNDAWGGACNDYDIYLWADPPLVGEPIRASAELQNCEPADNPLENIPWVPQAPGRYYISIARAQANGNHTFDLLLFKNPLGGAIIEHRTAAYSITQPADTDGPMLAVGAVQRVNPAELEQFSSQGPTTNGRPEPDIVALDGVSTICCDRFFGTSAASPHVAGAAALVKQANDGFSNSDIKQFLQGRAVDIYAAGVDNQSGSGRLDLGSVISPTASGQSYNLNVTTPGGRALVNFQGTAGHQVSALLTDLVNLGGCTAGRFAILKPDGTELVGRNICNANYVFLDTVALPVTGTYVLMLQRHGPWTGSGTATLYDVVDVTGNITADGTSVNVSTTTPGQRVYLDFQGTAGQRVSGLLTNMNFDGCWAGRFAILKPDGTELKGQDICNVSHVFIEPVTLPTNGTYKLMFDRSDRWTAQATMTLYTVVDVTGNITADGTPVTVSITTPGQRVYLDFPGFSGQRVSTLLTNMNFGGCWAGRFAILRPDGTELVWQDICNTSYIYFESITLPTNGTYKLMFDRSDRWTAQATMTLYTVVDVTGDVTVGGSPVHVDLTAPGQKALLTFSGTAGQQVTAEVANSTIPGCNAARLSFRKPDGTELTGVNYCNGSATLGPVSLPVDGTFTLMLDPFGTGTGQADLKVY